MNVIRANYVDIPNRRIFPAEIIVNNGKIETILPIEEQQQYFMIPGFVDAHIHIESSMLVPSEFARVAVLHGTVATISDPHEIANVLGEEGVHFMIENGKKGPFKFHFGAPSCVPATVFETAGATIDSDGIKRLMALDDIYYLAEVMNYPGVIFKDEELFKKMAWAKYFNKPIDGHAPGLRGENAQKYFSEGISTDHECFTFDEAQEKLKLNVKILIREGSAAKNFEALIPLLVENYQNMMFCSDDKHPDDLLIGHINKLCARAVALGNDVFDVLQTACVNPVKHYGMNVGLMQKGDLADFVLVNDLKNFDVFQTYINGELVAENGTSYLESIPFEKPNQFNVLSKIASDFEINSHSGKVRIIEALDGELITNEIHDDVLVENGFLKPNLEKDVLKITVVNRYNETKPAVAFVKNFGLKFGSIASSVAHDSHNIIAVGTTDEEIAAAVNLIIQNRGGVCAVANGRSEILSLPVAGIMSDKDGWETAKIYQKVDAFAKELGCGLRAPFMTLSFMALLVIPDLKLSDKGLFSGKKFQFVDLND